MKKLVFVVLLFSLSVISAQEVRVTSVKKVAGGEDQGYFHPKFNPDGSEILLTSPSYKGLWILSKANGNIEKLNDYYAAGYQPAFLNDGSIVFKKDEYRNRRKISSLIKQDVSNKTEQVIVSGVRDLSVPTKVAEGAILYRADNKMDLVTNSVSKVNSVNSIETAAYTRNGRLMINDGSERTLEPLGEGKYIWVSVSPDKQKILFNKLGDGTYISDLDGNIIADLGFADAPVWSPDGEWVAYMVDEDNGEVITASDIYVVSADGSESFKITDTEDEIEMYPDWSPAGNEIVYHTQEGEIFVAEINIVK